MFFRLLLHWVLRAASRADCIAGVMHMPKQPRAHKTITAVQNARGRDWLMKTAVQKQVMTSAGMIPATPNVARHEAIAAIRYRR